MGSAENESASISNSIIESKIQAILPGAEMEVMGADCDFTVTIICDGFDNLSSMKRQQMVLAAFADELASGVIHALTVKAFTLEEWNNKSSGLVQLSM